jgi:hypothetical protein
LQRDKYKYTFRFISIQALLLWWSAAAQAYASPWLQEPGDALLITTTETFSANDDSFRQVRTKSFVEFGLTENWMIGGTASYDVSESNGQRVQEIQSGFSEAGLYLQRHIWRQDMLQISGKLTYYTGTRQTRLSNGQTSVATRDPTLESTLLVGHTLSANGKHFTTAEISYRTSLGADADLVKADFTYGYQPNESWLLLLKNYNTFTADDLTTTPNAYEVHRLSPAIVWQRPRTSYELSVTTDLSGANISEGDSLTFGIWQRF